MDFGQAIKSGFRNYVNFSGRAIRSEYWFWTLLFVPIGGRVAGSIDGLTGLHAVGPIFGFATLLPSLAVTVRRLHDIDYSGWWILIGLIPLVGAIVLIVWFCSKGTTSYNRFGPDYFRPGGYASRRPGA
jgi:uncharacterized membrane protein YhaH (DUF805 family)